MTVTTDEMRSEVKTGLRGRRGWLAGAAAAVVFYAVMIAVTDAHFMADTADYVDSIAEHARGVDYHFWEFGHLLWRPLGWVTYNALRPLAEVFVGADERAQMTWALVALNWVAGLVAVVALYALLARFVRRLWVVVVTTYAFVLSHAFLNFTQSGSSYVFALAPLVVGLYFLTRGEDGGASLRDALAGGFALALAVCFWFPYVWAVPGALAAPLLLSRGAMRQRLRATLVAAVVCGVAVAVAYALVLAHLGIDSVEELRAWVAAASHGTDISGVTRMVFGFARSFINMGNDGLLFKRFLVKDPFNAVSAFDLFRLSLWKLGLFYLFLAAVAFNLLRAGSEGRRTLLFWLAGSAPLIVFAIKFDGGAVERYLPLYPFIFFAVARSLDHARAHRAATFVTLLFIFAATQTNLYVMSKPLQIARQQESAARVADLQPRLNPASKVFTVNWQDDLVNFNRSYPFHALNRGGGLKVNSLVTVGTTQVLRWREELAAQALEVWGAGGEVWVSRRALADAPRPEWNWTEGDDRRVSWRDFRPFFEKLDKGESLGGDDGFFLLAPSQANREALTRLVEADKH